MTWIKPSFLWMMYRCGWGSKEGQESALAVEITREGFEWALRYARLSHYEHGLHTDRTTWNPRLRQAPARVQWAPERDLHLQPLPHRSLQLGLTGEAAHLYADEWIVFITDVTPLARTIHAHVRDAELDLARQLLPRERPYPVDDETLSVMYRLSGRLVARPGSVRRASDGLRLVWCLSTDAGGRRQAGRPAAR